MSKKPTVLMILDGYGLNDRTDGNAVAQAKTPDVYKRQYLRNVILLSSVVVWLTHS